MKAIRTKYTGPTDTRGARIIASTEDRNRCSIPYPHELNQTEAHAFAARTLCEKMGWDGEMVGGGLGNDMVWVFTSEFSPRFTPAPDPRKASKL